MIQSPVLARCELDLSGTSWGDGEGVLPDNYTANVGREGVKVLASLPGSARVRRLTLWWNDVGDDGAASLGALPYLGLLDRIFVSIHEVGKQGLRALEDRFGPRLNNFSADTPA